MRARSHSIKLIAYELGLSQATVSGEITTGMRKLGVKSAIELARFTSETKH